MWQMAAGVCGETQEAHTGLFSMWPSDLYSRRLTGRHWSRWTAGVTLTWEHSWEIYWVLVWLPVAAVISQQPGAHLCDHMKHRCARESRYFWCVCKNPDHTLLKLCGQTEPPLCPALPLTPCLPARVCSPTGKWQRSFHQHQQQDQPWHLTQSSHTWEASRPWNWRWGRCGETSLGPWTTSSCSRISSGCSAWAWRRPTSAGTSISRRNNQERVPTWNGRNSAVATCHHFTAAARLGQCCRPGKKGGHRLCRARAPQGPAARPGLGMSTSRWPQEGATGSNGKENANSLLSQVSQPNINVKTTFWHSVLTSGRQFGWNKSALISNMTLLVAAD